MKMSGLFARGFLFALLMFLAAGTAFAQDRAVETGRGGIAAPAPAAAFSGSGKLTAAKFLLNTTNVSNSSVNNWVNLFSTSVTLNNITQCAKLSFSGEFADVNPNNTQLLPPFPFLLRAQVGLAGQPITTIDNGGKFFDLPHGDVIFDNNTPFNAVAFNWWVCGLAPGTYNVRIQFVPNIVGDTIWGAHRTLVIEYNQ